MSRLIILSLGLMLSFSSFAQDEAIQGFKSRFTIVRDLSGKMTILKLKKATTQFSVMPFIEQIKQDLLAEQASSTGFRNREAEIDQLIIDMGFDPYSKDAAHSEEALKVKEALMNLPKINVSQAFKELEQHAFWSEFEARLKEAFLYIDPTVLANLEDSRFFFKKNVTYKVVEWALAQAQKRFSNVPVLNIASFVIVRVHDMMLEQRYFHHNMLLQYFESIPETKLGMSKEEVDRTVSSIYEYRIAPLNIMESNRAAADWMNFGMDSFYSMVRSGNNQVRSWQAPMANVSFQNIKKINFAFAEVTEGGARKIYHLHLKNNKFSKKPALAYDYSNPKKVKRTRALLNLAGVGLGFIQMPGWLKGNVDSFMKSYYVEQVRMEGALVGYFESAGDAVMMNKIYAQRANFYIVQ
jgi:hypothetical protein